MGCDINWVLEAHRGRGWVGLIASKFTDYPAGSRWYAFFAELGLQGRGASETATPLRGLPPNWSGLAAMLYEEWADQFHSPSHLPLGEFVAAYNRALAQANGHREHKATPAELFGGHFWPDEDDETVYRVVFWFDN